MKKTLLAAFSLCLAMSTQAQFIGRMDARTAKAIAGGTVYVQNAEADSKKSKKLEKDPEAQAAYSDGITAINEAFENAFGKYWKLTEEVNFKSPSELRSMRKSAGPNDYVIYVDQQERKLEKGEPEGMNRTADLVLLPLSEDPNKALQPYKVPLPHPDPTEGDIIYGVQMMNLHLQSLAGGPSMDYKREMRTNADALRTKTLLLNSQDLDVKVDEPEKVSKLYSNAFEIVETQAINDAIVEANPQYAYVYVVRAAGPNMYTGVMVDAETGKICGVTSVSGSTGPVKQYPVLKEKNLRDLSRAVPSAPLEMPTVNTAEDAPAPPPAQEKATPKAVPAPAPAASPSKRR